MIDRGDIPAFKVGNEWRVHVPMFEDQAKREVQRRKRVAA
jgi:hypothetical protein